MRAHDRHMNYRAYDPIVQAAAKRPALWRLFLGVITVFVCTALWLFGLIFMSASLQGQSLFRTFETTVSLETQSPESSLLFVAIVWGLGVGTVIAAWIWQGRRWRTLTGHGSTTLAHFFTASVVAFSVIGALSVITLPFSERPTLNMDPTLWALFLPLGLTVVAGQTLSEEILFRGYIQSQLAGRFAHPILWMGVPSALFGLAHYAPSLPFSAASGYIMMAALFGLLAADLTARTGSIGAAWGFHFANNTMAILFVVSEGSLTGLGLFRTDEALSDKITLSPLIVVDIAVFFGIYLLIRRFVAR